MPRRRDTSADELVRLGRRLRELRLAAGLTQAQLAGDRFSHAYVSVIESGRRVPSRSTVEYFAQRLGVGVEELWREKGTSWAVQMAEDLRTHGLHTESRELLEKTLGNLERDSEVRPRVLVVLYLELARIAVSEDPTAERRYLERCLDAAGDDDSMLMERAEAQARLGDLAFRAGNSDEAIERYRISASLLLELLGRRPTASLV